MTIPTFDALVAAVGSGANPSWTHTPVASSGVNLVVATIASRLQTATACTYGGVAMTKYATVIRGELYASLFYLGNPPQGNQVVAMTVTANNYDCMSYSYTKCRGADPFRAGWTNTQGVGVGTLTLSPTAQNGDLAIDFLACISVGDTAAQTVGAGQVLRRDAGAGTAGGSVGGGQSEEGWSSGTTITMSWSMDTANANYILMAAVLKPPAGRSQLVGVI